jgi:hypothetical protein
MIESKHLSSELYAEVLANLQQRFPMRPLHSYMEPPPSPQSTPLRSLALFADYVVINRQQFTASSKLNTPRDSVVVVKISSLETHVGELKEIIIVNVPGIEIQRLGWIRWFVPMPLPEVDEVWHRL